MVYKKINTLYACVMLLRNILLCREECLKNSGYSIGIRTQIVSTFPQ